MSKKEKIKQWLTAVWKEDRLELIDEVFCQNARSTGPLSSIDDEQHYAKEITESLKSLIDRDLDIEFPLLEEFGDWVFTRFIMKAEGLSKQDDFSFDGIMIFKFHEDKICELHSQINYFQLFEGLEQLPNDCLHLCLTGAKFPLPEHLTSTFPCSISTNSKPMTSLGKLD